MKTVTIKTPADLMALRDDAGNVDIDGNLIVDCALQLEDTAGILSITVRGYADFRGTAYLRGNAYFRGTAYFQSAAEFRSTADFRGYAYFRGNADFGDAAYFWGDADFRGEILIIRHAMSWAMAHKPVIPALTYIKMILPPSFQREHWNERLGIDCVNGCYEEIIPRVMEKIDELLLSDKWSSTERWMLETLRDSEKPVPEWVGEFEEIVK